jgi:hypothetical protein
LLLQHFLLLVGLLLLRERPTRGVVATLTGGLLALLQYTYAAAHITLLHPAILLWKKGRWRAAVIVYATAALGMIPLAHSWSGRLFAPDMYDRRATDVFAMLDKSGRVFSTLWSPKYASGHTWAYPGAQTLPPALLIVTAAAVLLALRDELGRALVLIALTCALPNIVSNEWGGTSHRMMMMVMPLALIIAALPAVLPSEWRSPCAALLAATIVIGGAQRWTSPQFWSRLPGLQQHHIAYHDAVADAVFHAAPKTVVRLWPPQDAGRIVAVEHGWALDALSLQPQDLDAPGRLVIVWRNLPPPILKKLKQAGPVVTVTQVDPEVTITEFPNGTQGLLDGEPWRN